jgi:hypothetical protein
VIFLQQSESVLHPFPCLFLLRIPYPGPCPAPYPCAALIPAQLEAIRLGFLRVSDRMVSNSAMTKYSLLPKRGSISLFRLLPVAEPAIFIFHFAVLCLFDVSYLWRFTP